MTPSYIISMTICLIITGLLIYEMITYSKKRDSDDPLISSKQIILVILIPATVFIFNV